MSGSNQKPKALERSYLIETSPSMEDFKANHGNHSLETNGEIRSEARFNNKERAGTAEHRRRRQTRSRSPVKVLKRGHFKPK